MPFGEDKEIKTFHSRLISKYLKRLSGHWIEKKNLIKVCNQPFKRFSPRIVSNTWTIFELFSLWLYSFDIDGYLMNANPFRFLKGIWRRRRKKNIYVILLSAGKREIKLYQQLSLRYMNWYLRTVWLNSTIVLGNSCFY